MSNFIVVTGNIACGKTSVCKLLENMGTAYMSTDSIAKEIITLPEVVYQMTKRWGPIFFDEFGEIDFDKISNIVFNDPIELSFLERLTHRLIKKEIFIRKEYYDPLFTPFIALECPLFFEAEWHTDGFYKGETSFRHVIIIDAPLEKRLEFAKNKNSDKKFSKEEFLRRNSRFKSIKSKISELYRVKHLAKHIVIKNNKGIENLIQEIELWYKELPEIKHWQKELHQWEKEKQNDNRQVEK